MKKIKFYSSILALKKYLFKHTICVNLGEGNIGLSIVDPCAGRIIVNHYGISHCFAALLILSQITKSFKLYQTAERYLNYIENTIPKYAKEPGNHNDFNNLALSLTILLSDRELAYASKKLKEKALKLLLTTPDSNYPAVNWFPMRAINNFVRYEYTGANSYKKKAKKLLKDIEKAQNKDGMYEDLIPSGLSGNIQYHVYTTAMLQLIRHFEIDEGGGSLEKAIYFTSLSIDPEGDFNYFGRGTNQLFGWGPFFLNLEGMNISSDMYDRTKRFFTKNLQQCIDRNGLLLSNSHIDQYNYWWDYHYPTVYIAHLFLWLTIINIIYPKKIGEIKKYNSENLKVIKSSKVYCALYRGRTKYLCERGPQISNLWLKKYGTIFKGPFGPFFGKFGNKAIFKTMVVTNYLGPMTEYEEKRRIIQAAKIITQKFCQTNFLFKKFFYECGVILKPIFPKKIEIINKKDNVIEIIFILPKSKLPTCFNFPILSDASIHSLKSDIKIKMNGKEISLYFVCRSFGPYGPIDILRTKGQLGVEVVKAIVNLY